MARRSYSIACRRPSVATRSRSIAGKIEVRLNLNLVIYGLDSDCFQQQILFLNVYALIEK
jgi:hypothetical protein